MRFEEVVWREQFVDKLLRKQRVYPDEVEELLQGRPLVRRQERGRRKGEDLYAVYGQTGAGRYLVVFLIQKTPNAVLPISARDMTRKERANYEARRPRS